MSEEQQAPERIFISTASLPQAMKDGAGTFYPNFSGDPAQFNLAEYIRKDLTPVAQPQVADVGSAVKNLVDLYHGSGHCGVDQTVSARVRNCERCCTLMSLLDRVFASAGPASVRPPAPEIDLEWALRELADGWITNNERGGPHGFYQNARRVLTAIANDGADRQRESDAQIAEKQAGKGRTIGDTKAIAAAIRNAK